MNAPPRATLASFGALSFAYFASIGLFNPYAPLWLQSLGFSTLAIGSIASLQSWTRVVMPYAWSWLGDHSGQRERLMRVGAAGALASGCALLWARDYGQVALVVALLYAFNGAIVPLSEAALARHLGGADTFDAGRYGRVRVWGSLGFVLSVLAAGAVLERTGVSWFPVAVIVVGAGLLAAVWRLPLRREAVTAGGAAPAVLPVLRQPVVRWFFLSVALTVLAHTSLYAFFSLFLESRGFDKASVGLFWALSIVFEILFFWMQGRWFDRLTPWRWLQLAAAMTALRFAALAVAGQWTAVLVLTQASHAITFAAHHAACTQLLHKHFPGRLRGRGQALYSTLGYGLPGVLGGVGGGWLLQHASYEALYAAASAAALLAWACAWRAWTHHERASGNLPVH